MGKFVAVAAMLLVSFGALGDYRVVRPLTGMQCIDLAVIDSCKKHSIHAVELDSKSYSVQSGIVFSKVSKYRKPRQNGKVGTCELEIGYQDDNMFSPLGLIKRAANKLLVKYQFYDASGNRVKVNLLNFRCEKI